MKVEWAPWNIPFERRLQTLAVGIQMVSLIFGELVCMAVFVWLMVSVFQVRLARKRSGLE